MRVSQPVQSSVSWRQVAAFRLARHHLGKRAPVKSLTSVLRDIGGAQAQLLSAAQTSLWARVNELQSTHIDEALRQRALVRAACMRRTLFLVPSQDLAVFVRGTAARAEKEVRWTRGKGVPERTIDAAIEAALGALDRPLTRPEIADAVCRALGVRTQKIHGGGWGSRRKVAAVPVGELTFPVVDLLHMAAARGVICYGPSQENEPTFVRADTWIPGWQDLPREAAEDQLLRIYLRAYGPATAADFALWSGTTLREARQIWIRASADLAEVDVQGWSAHLLRQDLDALTHARIESPLVRLLPYFDSFLLGHRERKHLVAAEHLPRVYRPQGWVAPVVLVNGRIAALWEHARQGSRLRVTVTPLAPKGRRPAAGLREEARRLAHFLGAEHVDVQIEGK